MAKRFGAEFFEVSAKNNLGVEAPFSFASQKSLHAESSEAIQSSPTKEPIIKAPVPSSLLNKKPANKLLTYLPVVLILIGGLLLYVTSSSKSAPSGL